MLGFLAQTDLGGFAKLAQDYGLGIVMSGFVATVLFFLLRNMIKSHSKNMENMVSLINKRDDTLDNHIDHLTAAVEQNGEHIKLSVDKLVSSQEASAVESRTQVASLVTEQRHQTEMVREILENRLGNDDRNRD